MSHIKNRKQKIENRRQKGVSILFAVLIMNIILAIGLGISFISLQQTKMMREVGYSVIAFYAADNGIERGLYALYVEGVLPPFSEQGYLDLNENGSQDSEDSTYSINTIFPGADCEALNICLKSIGIYKGTSRAIEIRY